MLKSVSIAKLYHVYRVKLLPLLVMNTEGTPWQDLKIGNYCFRSCKADFDHLWVFYESPTTIR